MKLTVDEKDILRELEPDQLNVVIKVLEGALGSLEAGVLKCSVSTPEGERRALQALVELEGARKLVTSVAGFLKSRGSVSPPSSGRK